MRDGWVRLEIVGGGFTWVRADALRSIHQATDGIVYVGVAGRERPIGPVKVATAEDVLKLLADLMEPG